MQPLYSCSPVLITLWFIYRPFVTKLDNVKYLALATLFFIARFTILSEENDESVVLPVSARNHTPIDQYDTQFSMMALYINFGNQGNKIRDAFDCLIISFIGVTISCLFTRWHLPITFVKPNTSYYLALFMRQGLTIIFYVTAMLR
jgi:hypothetical protein